MFEGIQINPPWRQPRVLSKFVASIDYMVPLLDIGYIFFWIPGVILFVAGYPVVVGWISIAIIPITATLYWFLRAWQERNVFRRLAVHPRRDISGFWAFLVLYQALTSAAALQGYAQYITGSARRWK
jgi:biofilm PGA synthesis N-glycosyltransferase PgaC